MTGRELLELAAKAAGIDAVYEKEYLTWFDRGRPFRPAWNPLIDDGDALRLAVKLEMLVCINTCYYVSASKEHVSVTEHIGNDGKGCIYAATRRAIVRAAAEIGKGMP